MAGEANAQNLVRKELAELLKLAGPVILGRLGIMIMGLTDAIVVGRYSATQLGYHALGWAPTAVVMTVALGLLSGVQVMTSRAIGEGRLAETGAVLRRGLAYALQMGLAAYLVLALAQLGYIVRSTILNRVRYRVARTGAPASAVRRPTPAYLAPYG